MVEEALQAYETMRNGTIAAGVVTFLLFWFGKLGLAIACGVVFVIMLVALLNMGGAPA